MDYSSRICYNLYEVILMEIRELKISANASGGTAAAGAKTYRITLPSSWVKKMDLDHADAKAEVVFDGTSIIIRPKAAEDILLFQSQALKAGHEVVRYEYFDQKNLCSTILCDFTEKILRVKNHYLVEHVRQFFMKYCKH